MVNFDRWLVFRAYYPVRPSLSQEFEAFLLIKTSLLLSLSFSSLRMWYAKRKKREALVYSPSQFIFPRFTSLWWSFSFNINILCYIINKSHCVSYLIAEYAFLRLVVRYFLCFLGYSILHRLLFKWKVSSKVRFLRLVFSHCECLLK